MATVYIAGEPADADNDLRQLVCPGCGREVGVRRGRALGTVARHTRPNPATPAEAEARRGVCGMSGRLIRYESTDDHRRYAPDQR